MTRKKKILFVITKSNFGGAQRYVYDLATHLPKERYEVVVAYGTAGTSNDAPGMLSELLAKAGVRTIYIPKLGRDISLVEDVRTLRTLISMFRDERPDILHLNSSKIGGLGALAGRISHVPRIIYTAHGWPFRETRNILSRIAIWLVSYVNVLLAHVTICVSEADRRACAYMPCTKDKVVRIWNGIDLHMTFGSGERIRSAFPVGAHITGTIGELTRNKNQAALIEKARETTDMYVAIVGEGELRRMLEERIRTYGLEARVKLFGFVPAAEVLKGFDRFALPSRKEGLPYVLIEAKLAGLPIVTERVGGIGEILDTDINVFSIERMVNETLALYES